MKGLRLRPAGRRSLLSVGCALALLAAPAARAAGPYRVPSPVVKTLDNGLKVLVFPDPRLPVVELQIRLPAGVDAEPPDQNGVATVTARMLSLGTISRDAQSFDRELTELGTTLSASVGREFATLSAAFLSRDFDSGIELMGDAVVHPIFPEDPFQQVVSQVGRNLIQLHQNPLAAAGEEVWTVALPDVPAARPPLGTLESLGLLTRDQVRAFYRDRFHPEGAALAIAGDVTPERAFAAAAEWFGAWPASGAPAADEPRAQSQVPGAPRIRIVDQPAAGGCALALGIVVPGRGSPDGLARSVAVAVLDQRLGERLAGRTGRDARSSLEQTRDFGLWTVQATCPAESVAVLARRLKAELRRFLSAPPAAREVAAMQRRIRGGFPLAFETAAGLMNQWLLADFAGFSPDYFDRYGARISALKPEVLHAAVRRDADPEHPVIVAVGAAKKLEPLLAVLGPVEIVGFGLPSEFSAAPAETLPAPTAEQEASGRKVVADALVAHGGRDRLSGITSSLVDADVTLFLPGHEVTGVLRQLRKEPYQMAFVSSLEGMDSRQVLNGNRAWTVLAGSDTVQEGDSLDVATLRTGFTSDLPHVLLAAADAKAHVAARGRERIGGREGDRVEVVSASGGWRMLHFEAASHRLLAVDQRERGPGGVLLVRRVYSDYRPVDGVQWPFQEARFVSGKPLMKLNATRVQLNPELSGNHFEPPESGGARWR